MMALDPFTYIGVVPVYGCREGLEPNTYIGVVPVYEDLRALDPHTYNDAVPVYKGREGPFDSYIGVVHGQWSGEGP